MTDTLTQDQTQDQTQDGTDATQTPNAGSGLDVVVDENVYAVTRTPSKVDGQPAVIGFGILKEGNKLDKSIKAGEVELVLKKTVSVPYAASLAGIQKLIKDEDEMVTVFNNGATSKVTTRLRSYMTEQNEAGEFVHLDDGDTFDAADFLAEPMKRKTLTDAQKLFKAVSGASKEDLVAVLKEMGILV